MDGRERTARYRARLRGAPIPLERPGPKQGFKQSTEHVNKRKRWGEDHPRWIGDRASTTVAYKRTHRRFTRGACSECGAPDGERHHKDGNLRNNDKGNIAILCRTCHVAAHGR